jgi:hypothetical protein
MPFFKLVAALSVLAGCTTAQEPAQDVVFTARIGSHMRDELAKLPNYTCLETNIRFRKEPDQFNMKSRDTVRLEILYSGHREWYGAPGDRNFRSDTPRGFIRSGMIGSGFFGITLNNIFLSRKATVMYRGEEMLKGRTAVRHDFRLPRPASGLELSIAGFADTVGEQGSFWVDPQSLDLIRLESRVDEIPLSLLVRDATFSMDYARTRIGERSVLLPQQADLHMVRISDEESYDRLEFTHCRAFSVQSTLRFDAEPRDPAEPLPPGATKGLSGVVGIGDAMPALLPITIHLTKPITDRDSVGNTIEARVSGDVVRKGKIIIPNGSVVRGRIRRLEQNQTDENFIVGLEFTDVEVNGGTLRFYADLLRMDRSPGIRPIPSEQVAFKSGETIILPELPGVASFFIHGATFVVPSGFRMVWRSRDLNSR